MAAWAPNNPAAPIHWLTPAWPRGVALTPTLSRRERGSMAAWAVGVALTPTLSQRERGLFDTAWNAGMTISGV